MIPEAKTAAVTRALSEAFGVTEFEDIRLMTAGLTSALVFRIVVRGHPYLLRVITRTDANTDPTRQFTCMKIAADAGLAPRVWYTKYRRQGCDHGFRRGTTVPHNGACGSISRYPSGFACSVTVPETGE